MQCGRKLQWDKCNVTNAMGKMQWKNSIGEMQCDKCPVTNENWQIYCDKYNEIIGMW